MLACYEQGIDGLLLKSLSPQVFVKSVALLLAGERFYHPTTHGYEAKILGHTEAPSGPGPKDDCTSNSSTLFSNTCDGNSLSITWKN